MTHPSKTSPNGSMTRFEARGTLSKRIIISRCLIGLRFMNTASWSVSASRWMMRTYGMICVTPYVGEARFVTSKTGFMPTELLRIGIGTEMKRYERLPWRGVRHMELPIRNKGTASWVSRLYTGDDRQPHVVMPWVMTAFSPTACNEGHLR